MRPGGTPDRPVEGGGKSPSNLWTSRDGVDDLV
jgi:hypothetical protein